jgi:hypothetical protein
MYRFPIRLNLSETLHMGYTQHRGFWSLFRQLVPLELMTEAVKLWITVELEITSQAANFFIQRLSFLAYGGGSILKTLNQTPFHMQQTVRVEVKVLASVGGFSVDFDLHCCLLVTRTEH